MSKRIQEIMKQYVKQFLIIVLSILIGTSNNASSTAAELTGQDKEFAYVLYNAWKELDAYSNSQGPLKVTVHAGSDIKKVYSDEIKKGVQLVVDKYSGYLLPTDEFHIIIASNLADAKALILELNELLPGYIEYNKSHLKRASDWFNNPCEGFNACSGFTAGSTSSRGCWFQGGPYGRISENHLNPCPRLPGGADYFFADESGFVRGFGNLDSTGGHEAFHGILGYLNPGSHWNTSNWIIEGTMQTIGLAAVTNKTNLGEYGTLINPSPSELKPGGYDLRYLDNNQNSTDVYTVGVLAVSLLINDYGADKYFKFLLEMGFPKKGEDQLYDYFGITKEDFYKRFYDYSDWYYKGGHEKIKYINFETGTYSPPKDKIKSSKKTFSCVNKENTVIKEFRKVKIKCPKGYRVL